MGFFSKLGEKIDKGISWIGQQLKKFATLAADFFRRRFFRKNVLFSYAASLNFLFKFISHKS